MHNQNQYYSDWLQSSSATDLIFRAAENNNLVLLEYLLQYNIDVNLQDRLNRTALHWFAWHGNVQAIRLLLSRNANPNLVNWVGWTPIFCAVYRGQANAVRLLLGITDLTIYSGSDYSYEGPVCPRYSTVYDIAIIINNPSILALLLEVTVSTAAMFIAAQKNDFALLQHAIENNANINAQDEFQRTALHWFAWHGNEQAVKLLLECGADLNLTNWVGWTPIFCAIYQRKLNIVRTLASITDLSITSIKNYEYQGAFCPLNSTALEIARIVADEAIATFLEEVYQEQALVANRSFLIPR